ncbi:hypothetical protein ACS0TY_012349 [Phlomoides rotata]
MMVSFSNGSLSGEASNKRPLENGYVPKYKPRKVSAYREFPPGCGPNAVPENIKPEDNGFCQNGTVGAAGVLNLETTNAVVANGAGTSRATYPMEAEVVGNSGISNPDEIKDSGKQNFVGSNGVEDSDIKECQPHETEINSVDGTKSLDAIVEEVMANVNVSKKLVMEIGPLRIQLPDEVGSHEHGDVNNPVEMDKDQLLDSYVGEVTTTVTNGFSKEGEELLPETNLIGVDGKKSGGIERETSIRPKDKYRPRRVSAIRDFPPLCGMHGSLAVKEKQMVVSGNGCLDRTEEVESAPSAAMPKNVSERETSKEVLMRSDEGLVGVQNVPFETDTTETLNDDAGRGLPAESAEAGPMGFENCNTDLQHSITEKTGASPGSGTISKAVINISIKDTGGPVGKEIAVGSSDIDDKDGPHHDSNKEVVHGLMAAVNCPWRKSKVTLKNTDGGTSGQKQKQQDLSQTPKPNAVALNSNLKANCSGGPSLEETAFRDSNDKDGTPDSLTYVDEEDRGAYDDCALDITPISMFMDENDNGDNDYTGPIQNDVIVYAPGDNDETRPFTEDDMDREVVHGLMAAPNCPWRKGKTVLSNVDGEMRGEVKRKPNTSWRKKAKARKSNPKLQSSGAPLKKKNKVHVSNDVDDCTPKMQSSGAPSKKKNKVHISSGVDNSPGAVMLPDDGDHDFEGDFPTNPTNHKTRDIVVNLPPFGTNSSSPGDARMRVREILRHFYTVYRKSLQQEEANSKPEEEGKSKQFNRIDLMTAKFLKENGKVVNTEKIIGPVPGVEVGDEFQYRVELAIVGIHFPYQSGIDSTKINDVPLCTSIVASGGYSDNLDDADVLIYSGQGGNAAGNLKTKQAEDQKLERGNLALKNCIETKTPVRVVRGWKESKIVDPLDVKPKLVSSYIYDGLYMVTDYWTETGPRGKQVFQFKLERNPGQPELAWKELKKSNKFKTRPGTCVSDISEGKESLPIAAVNTIDDQKPPPFNYISKMMYPDWLRLKPPQGCDCNGRCSDSKRCPCAEKNGGEIPYNRNGALVETKTVVYECGPNCKCPPSCYNRASQRGIKYKLEIFKTESRGWGVRPLTSIPSGSFICEYAGELLEDKEAEQRIGNDEYLFDIGHDVSDSTEPEGQEIAAEITEGGFTIDACQYGSIGRFINHSCLPNLHAQNVIFDHDNKRMPHIMLFAMENIPPLQELTYHYNYHKGSVYDSDGNIKRKECYCGAEKCDGKLY